MKQLKRKHMKKIYVVGLDAKHPVTTFKQVETDSFEDVEQFVSQCVWTYSDAIVEVFKNDKLIKHLIIKRG